MDSYDKYITKFLGLPQGIGVTIVDHIKAAGDRDREGGRKRQRQADRERQIEIEIERKR